MKHFATAVWNGSGLKGNGQITLESRNMDQARYTFNSRFNSDNGTNPEELLAAVHASDFTMKLSFILDGIGFEASRLETTCYILFEWGQISSSHFILRANVPGIGKEELKKCAEEAIDTGPVSRILKVKISIEVILQ